MGFINRIRVTWSRIDRYIENESRYGLENAEPLNDFEHLKDLIIHPDAYSDNEVLSEMTIYTKKYPNNKAQGHKVGQLLQKYRPNLIKKIQEGARKQKELK